jgi:hypothetical protein
MPDLGALALGVYHDERRFGYCVLRRLMQLRCVGRVGRSVACRTRAIRLAAVVHVAYCADMMGRYGRYRLSTFAKQGTGRRRGAGGGSCRGDGVC